MIGIIGAMEEEIRLLRESMANVEDQEFGGFHFILGKLAKKDVVLLRCGIGKVNAAVGCSLLVDHFKPAFVVNTGSAGGIDPELTFGDVVVSDGLVYHDVDVTAFGYAPGQVPGQSAVFPVPEELILRGEGAVDVLKRSGVLPSTLNHVRGLIGSGDVFMHDADRIASVRSIFPKIKAVEMEGAAIAHACALFATPVLVIRAVSDVAGKESPMKFEEFLPLAAKHSSEIVRKIIEES